MKKTSLDNKLFKVYNKLLYCKYKQTMDLDITNYILDFNKFVSETELSIENSTSLFVDLIIYTLLYSNVRETLYDVLLLMKYRFEPEEENLIVGYMEELKNDILELNPLLKESKLIVPFDVIRVKDRTILRLLVCFEK